MFYEDSSVGREDVPIVGGRSEVWEGSQPIFKKRQARRRFDLTYFRNSLIKRFPHCSKTDVDIAIDQSLDAMKPSRDRTRLKRLVVPILVKREEAKAKSA